MAAAPGLLLIAGLAWLTARACVSKWREWGQPVDADGRCVVCGVRRWKRTWHPRYHRCLGRMPIQFVDRERRAWNDLRPGEEAW